MDLWSQPVRVITCLGPVLHVQQIMQQAGKQEAHRPSPTWETYPKNLSKAMNIQACLITVLIFSSFEGEQIRISLTRGWVVPSLAEIISLILQKIYKYFLWILLLSFLGNRCDPLFVQIQIPFIQEWLLPSLV